MKCINCGAQNCRLVAEDLSARRGMFGKSVCSGPIMGPLGSVFASCPLGTPAPPTHYWVCQRCRTKFKA